MKFTLNNVKRNFSSAHITSVKENDKFRRFSIHVGERNKDLYKYMNHFNNSLYILNRHDVSKIYTYGGNRQKYFSSFMKNVIEQVKKDMKENKQYQEALKELKEQTEINEKTTKIKNKIEESIKWWKHIKDKNVEAIKLIYHDIHTFVAYSFENVYILKFSKTATINLYYLLQNWIIRSSDKINKLKGKWEDNSAFVQLDKWRQEMAIKRYKKNQQKEEKKGLHRGKIKETEAKEKEVKETEENEWKEGNENLQNNLEIEKREIDDTEVADEQEPIEKFEKQRNELILAQESAWDRFGSKLKDMPFLYNFFENPVWGKLFGETELAAALREMKIKDKNFKLSELIYLFEYVISKHIVESYLIGDEETLKLHCGTAAFNSLNASINERKKKKVNLDTNVLIYKNHELKGAQRIEESFPWFIFTFHTQQINCLRNHNDEIIEGKIDDIREVVYTIALSKHPKPETEGLLYPYIIREFAIIGNTPSW